VIIAIALTACVGCSNNGSQQSVNVLVVVEDAGEDSLPRNHRASRKLVDKVSDTLNFHGINVYDQTALSLDDFDLSYGRMGPAELVNMARSVKSTSLDYLVVVSVDANVQNRSSRQKIATRLFATTIKVHSGRVVGSASESGSTQSANGSCSRSCLNEKISDSVNRAAGDLATQVLSDLPSATHASTINNQSRDSQKSNNRKSYVDEYVLIFDGFNASEMTEVEEYLTIYSGYQNMRYSEARHTYAEIWYKSSITTAKLNRNIKRMFNEMNVRAMVSMESNIVTMKKITLRGRKSKESDFDSW